LKVLFIDGYNLFHRARYGYSSGEYSTVFTFFRSFRSLVERMSVDKVIVALEGYPEFRHELYPEYKANRKADPADLKKAEEYRDFSRQKDIIIDLLCKLPIEVLKHPKYEGDDLIGKLVTSIYKDDDCIVITADSDFNQLFNQTNNVRIYNPIKKSWVKAPEYNYVMYKAMVGDTADNIKGIHRVGHKTAEKVLAKTAAEVSDWLDERPERRSTVTRNQKLIRFADVPIREIINISKEPDLASVRNSFEKMNFKSIISEKSWLKFEDTFSF